LAIIRARRGPRGIARSEIERLFGGTWQIVSSEIDLEVSNDSGDPIHIHELRRR
jgi:hypothetical protein